MHILVETIGLLLHALVHPADIQDRDGGVLRSTYIKPFMTARISTVRFPPPRFAGGISGPISAHSASVTSVPSEQKLSIPTQRQHCVDLVERHRLAPQRSGPKTTSIAKVIGRGGGPKGALARTVCIAATSSRD
ncbi:hypothetical+protein [Methylocapsa aurea]